MSVKTQNRIPCTHCGKCCKAKICNSGASLFRHVAADGVCPALVKLDNDLYYCDIILNHYKYVPQNFPPVKFFYNFAERIGIAIGCELATQKAKDNSIAIAEAEKKAQREQSHKREQEKIAQKIEEQQIAHKKRLEQIALRKEQDKLKEANQPITESKSLSNDPIAISKRYEERQAKELEKTKRLKLERLANWYSAGKKGPPTRKRIGNDNLSISIPNKKAQKKRKW